MNTDLSHQLQNDTKFLTLTQKNELIDFIYI